MNFSGCAGNAVFVDGTKCLSVSSDRPHLLFHHVEWVKNYPVCRPATQCCPHRTEPGPSRILDLS